MNTRHFTKTKRWSRGVAVLACALPLMCSATDPSYINTGIKTSPPDPVPQVDAVNFINSGYFTVTLEGTAPYETANTLNYTNSGQMQCNRGFGFVSNPTATGIPRWAANFENTGRLISGETSHLTIWATNVVCRGTTTVGPDGQFSVQGRSVSLRRGTVNLSPAGTFTPSGIPGTPTWETGPGRLLIQADGTLNLELAHMSGWNYMRLNATNHYQGSPNARIAVAMSDLYLRSTNGTLLIKDLLAPTLSWRGDSPSRLLTLELTATNDNDVVISDILNVTRDFRIDTKSLTITSNDASAQTPRGELNYITTSELLPANLPLLQNLTNNGAIFTGNAATFGSPAGWYQNFINRGDITTEGLSLFTTNFENGGTIDVGVGSFALQAQQAGFSNALTLAFRGDVSIYASDLMFSNHSVYAGRRLTIAATNSITDGVVVTNQLTTPVSTAPVLAMAYAAHDFTQVASNAQYKVDHLLVRFDPSIESIQHAEILTELGGGEILREYRTVPGLCLVQLPAGQTVEQALQSYNQTAGVLYAEPDYQVRAEATIPNDALFDQLWGMNNTGQTGGTPGADIDAPEAWDLSTGDQNVIVAVIDTGVDYTHEDLTNNMWMNPGEIPDNQIDDDGNGFVDDVYGYDFFNGDGDPMDDNDHGTHVSGTVGAEGDNGIGVAGVCWQVNIMALKFLGAAGFGFTSDAVSCVDYATQMGAQVMNNSWGGGGYSQSLKDAIDAAGVSNIVFVAAAGNGGIDGIGDDNDLLPFYPASYDSDNIISVMSTDDNDERSLFSNYGRFSVDLGAPGSDILSCVISNGYAVFSGTSMASPHVAGACALMLAVDPSLTVSQIKDRLLLSVDPTLIGLCESGGRLNLANALSPTGGLITEPNTWVARDGGVGLLHRAATGDLLGITLKNIIGDLVEAPVSWAGEDRGISADGYVDNSALGRLIFDAGEDALFHVQAVGSSSALYVDFLELRDFATNRVVSGGSTNFIAFSIDPNMKIYYAGAVANGASITEELNGANGGGFVWVPSFAGVFSSTNLVFPGGSTYKLNRSLVESSNLDSDGDGIVNSLDQTPVLVGSEINLTIGRTNLPPMASLLSWTSVPGSVNYVYYKDSLTDPDWRLLTNFTLLPDGTTKATVVDTNNLLGSRVYRVGVDANLP